MSVAYCVGIIVLSFLSGSAAGEILKFFLPESLRSYPPLAFSIKPFLPPVSIDLGVISLTFGGAFIVNTLAIFAAVLATVILFFRARK